MKILHIYHSLNIGGIDTFIVGLANEMSKEHDVTICTFKKMSANDGLISKLNNNVTHISLGNKKLSSLNNIVNIFKIALTIRKGRYDIIQLHGNFNIYILSILLFKEKSSFFYTIHSDAYKENGPMGRKLLFIKKYFFKHRYITPITISKESQNSFNKLYNCENFLIENGIILPKIDKNCDPIKYFRISTNSKIFVHIGRISIPKNQLVLCKVFDRLIKEGKDVILLIIGPREDETIYKDISTYFSNRIIYLGPQDNIHNYLFYCDAMCLPSIFEGLPITLLESIAVGCIPICSPVGGIVNVIENEVNGFLSNSPSEEDYYACMLNFLSKTDRELKNMKCICLEDSKKYDISNTAKEYLECYKKFLKI